MFSKLRQEISFKDIDQLQKKIEFCLGNSIYKINIPCKGNIKKDFLIDVVKFIGKNYKNLDVIYHYSFYHQYYRNKKFSYDKFLNFIELNKKYNNNNEILIVSGSQKRKEFEVLSVLKDLKSDLRTRPKFGIAYNPYFSNKFEYKNERNRLLSKLDSEFIDSIWLQFGSEINYLKRELSFLKKINFISDQKIDIGKKLYGSIFIPSKQFLARFKFRPWRGVFLSNDFLNSLEYSCLTTKEIYKIYCQNNITPLIETECSNIKQFNQVENLLEDDF